jgi:hypothetical protein
MLGYYAINIPPIFGGAFIAKCQGPNNEALEYGCRIWLSRVKPTNSYLVKAPSSLLQFLFLIFFGLSRIHLLLITTEVPTILLHPLLLAAAPFVPPVPQSVRTSIPHYVGKLNHPRVLRPDYHAGNIRCRQSPCGQKSPRPQRQS